MLRSSPGSLRDVVGLLVALSTFVMASLSSDAGGLRLLGVGLGFAAVVLLSPVELCLL